MASSGSAVEMKIPYFGVLLALCACTTSDSSTVAGRPSHYGFGHAPTREQIAAIDIDANPAGVGLPVGEGTAQSGRTIYVSKCSMCHGANGEGIDKYPRLIGHEPPAGFAFASDPKAPRTIGNYWPYATTLYDYIHRTMPWSAPGSLTPDETYSVVAYLLSANGVIPETTVVNAKSLPAVRMPAQPHFVKDNRTGGATFR
jgi:mono/diheme cytochrome c family protein